MKTSHRRYGAVGSECCQSLGAVESTVEEEVIIGEPSAVVDFVGIKVDYFFNGKERVLASREGGDYKSKPSILNY